MEFAEYVARRRPALLRFATVLACRTWLAEDLVSDVLGREFERWDRISVMAEPNACVRRMVVTEYLSWHRGLTRTSPRAEVEPVVISDGGDERLVPAAATVVAVAGLVAGAVWLVPGDSGTHTAGPPTTSASAPSTTATRSPVPHSPDELIARFRVVLGDAATFEVTQEHLLPPPSSTSSSPGTGVTKPSPEGPDASTTALVGGTLTSAGGIGASA
jgi:hypothetical protein